MNKTPIKSSDLEVFDDEDLVAPSFSVHRKPKPPLFDEDAEEADQLFSKKRDQISTPKMQPKTINKENEKRKETNAKLPPKQAEPEPEQEIKDYLQIGDGPFHIGPGGDCYLFSATKMLQIQKKLFEYLMDHQRQGLAWLWKIHLADKGLGGILAVILNAILTQNRMIWVLERQSKVGKFRVKSFYGNSKSQRESELNVILEKGGICLTTYGMVTANLPLLTEDVKWDYVILDEGHKIKNPSAQITKAVKEIPSKRRLVLTGTPVMNNLQEMWSLFDFACQGKLLGELKTFRFEFEEVIVKGNDKKASLHEKKMGIAVAQTLRDKISPFMLRREKQEIIQAQSKQQPSLTTTTTTTTTTPTSSTKSSTLKATTEISSKQLNLDCRKNDFIVWLKISDVQHKLYKEFLSSEEAHAALNKTNSPLAALSVMKKICDHPQLLHKEMKTVQNVSFQSLTEAKTMEELILQSGKLTFLFALLKNIKVNRHRILIFSQSAQMLDIVESILNKKKYSLLRIDGSVLNPKERQRRINLFNSDPNIDCFLLTTNVGGLGLNLTSADRAVILDPSWNANDDQAVDRIYRIGQTKNVVIYRLVTCGTIEEKAYRKQVFKSSLMKTLMSSDKQHRYFTKQELSELFILDDISYSVTQQQLESLHSKKRNTDEELEEHILFLHSLGICGLSDHNLLFTETPESLAPDAEHQQLSKQNMEKLDSSSSLVGSSSSGSSSSKKKTQTSSSATANSDSRESFLKDLEDLLQDNTTTTTTTTTTTDPSIVESAVTTKQNEEREEEEGEEPTIPMFRPMMTLGNSQKESYNESLLVAKQKEEEKNWEKSIENYMKALCICDEDLLLHQKIVSLAARLNWISVA